jgi:MoxR-like ATPase
VDRFLFKLSITYPQRAEERRIMDTMTSVVAPGGARNSGEKISPVVTPDQIRSMREVIDNIYIDDKVKDYILELVSSTRDPQGHRLQFRSREGRHLEEVISYGASPRASIALVIAAKTHAFLRHRGHVTPDDVKAIGPDVLRHRIMITFEAEAEELTTDMVIRQIFDQVEVP